MHVVAREPHVHLVQVHLSRAPGARAPSSLVEGHHARLSCTSCMFTCPLMHRVHVHLARSCTSSEPCGMCTSRRAPREDVNAYLPAQRVRYVSFLPAVYCVL